MRTRCHYYAEEYQNNTVMRNPYAEEYRNNTVSQISGKISRMHKWLNQALFAPLPRESEQESLGTRLWRNELAIYFYYGNHG